MVRAMLVAWAGTASDHLGHANLLPEGRARQLGDVSRPFTVKVSASDVVQLQPGEALGPVCGGDSSDAWKEIEVSVGREDVAQTVVVHHTSVQGIPSLQSGMLLVNLQGSEKISLVDRQDFWDYGHEQLCHLHGLCPMPKGCIPMEDFLEYLHIGNGSQFSPSDRFQQQNAWLFQRVVSADGIRGNVGIYKVAFSIRQGTLPIPTSTPSDPNRRQEAP
jgi:hypothetical protein